MHNCDLPTDRLLEGADPRRSHIRDAGFRAFLVTLSGPGRHVVADAEREEMEHMDIVRMLAGPPAGRRPRHLGRAIITAVTVILGVLGLQEAALAETGRQRFHITYAGSFDPNSFPARPATASGTIHGKGYDLFITQAPGPEPGSFQSASQLVFPEGSLSLAYTGTFEFRFNPHACRARTRVTGTWTITSGTGLYTGATGEGTLTGHNTFSGDRAPGGCPDQPDRLVTNLRLMGTVTVPDPGG